MQEFTQAIGWLAAHPLVSEWYTAVARLLFPILSALILIRANGLGQKHQRHAQRPRGGLGEADAHCPGPMWTACRWT